MFSLSCHSVLFAERTYCDSGRYVRLDHSPCHDVAEVFDEHLKHGNGNPLFTWGEWPRKID